MYVFKWTYRKNIFAYKLEDKQFSELQFYATWLIKYVKCILYEFKCGQIGDVIIGNGYF